MARHYLRFLLVLVSLGWPATSLAADGYNHDRFVTQPVDAVRASIHGQTSATRIETLGVTARSNGQRPPA